VRTINGLDTRSVRQGQIILATGTYESSISLTGMVSLSEGSSDDRLDEKEKWKEDILGVSSLVGKTLYLKRYRNPKKMSDDHSATQTNR
jgi:hypothetical protein